MKNKIIVYQTDTVWGIGGNIFSSKVHEEICKIKNTLNSKPLSILFCDLEMLKEYLKLDEDFLTTLFLPLSKMQVTFSIDRNLITKDLPNWCHFFSDKIYIRFLPELDVSLYCKKNSSPIFSTSLNITGEKPIIKNIDAKKFFDDYVKEGVFIEGNDSKLSGESSTIISLLDKKNAQILRKGKFVDQIKVHIKKLGIKTIDL